MTTYYIPTQSLPVLQACRAFTKAKSPLVLHPTPINQAAYNANYRHPDTVRWSPNYQPRLGDVFIYQLHDKERRMDSYVSARVGDASSPEWENE